MEPQSIYISPEDQSTEEDEPSHVNSSKPSDLTSLQNPLEHPTSNWPDSNSRNLFEFPESLSEPRLVDVSAVVDDQIEELKYRTVWDISMANELRTKRIEAALYGRLERKVSSELSNVE